jgi:ribA/ribD-fused uncharacterized protein
MKTKSYYETDTHVYFYGSCYSQWAMRSFELDGNLFNCCEQYMMYRKAKLFGDHESAKKIWSSGDPAEQKALGRKVKNFDKDKWEEIARDVVYKANYAKFTQNEDCKQQLLETKHKIIVEASPTDCIWGVGLWATDCKILDSKNWRGTNWLGEAIMKVRKALQDIDKQSNQSYANIGWDSM